MLNFVGAEAGDSGSVFNPKLQGREIDSRLRERTKKRSGIEQ